jgi:RNA polymerase sigma-70 factor (ECF subfamily)
LDQFRGEAAFSTWLTRILINEAYGRVRRRKPNVDFTAEAEPAIRAHISSFPRLHRGRIRRPPWPTQQMRALLEQAIDALPEPFRVIFVARVVEEMSVEETAALFNLKPETVKTRLHRARAKLRESLGNKCRRRRPPPSSSTALVANA